MGRDLCLGLGHTRPFRDVRHRRRGGQSRTQGVPGVLVMIQPGRVRAAFHHKRDRLVGKPRDSGVVRGDRPAGRLARRRWPRLRAMLAARAPDRSADSSRTADRPFDPLRRARALKNALNWPMQRRQHILGDTARQQVDVWQPWRGSCQRDSTSASIGLAGSVAFWVAVRREQLLTGIGQPISRKLIPIRS